MFTTNQKIVDASLIVLHKHKTKRTKRSLRPLVVADFDRIRQAQDKFASAWSLHRHLHTTEGTPLLTYYKLRVVTLDQWQKKHGWQDNTRNLYGSVLSTLKNWEQHGIPRADQDLLVELRPGASLFTQFFPDCETALI